MAGFEILVASGEMQGTLWRPVKRKQALLRSNLPRDSRIRRENDSVASGRSGRTLFPAFAIILLSCHALKTCLRNRHTMFVLTTHSLLSSELF